jgi:hypothetical protein
MIANVVTVCNRIPREPYYCLEEFKKSLKGHDLYMLGTRPGQYTGLGDKPKLLFECLSNGWLKEKYTIFCDSWDLVLAQSIEEIIERYKWFDAPIVISSEKNCFPDDLKKEYDELNPPTSYKYLNSGMIVGETSAFYEMLVKMDLENVPSDYWDAEKNCNVHINDQFLYQQIFLKQPVKMVLDYEQLLCNTLHLVTIDDLDFSKESIQNKETKTFPCAFHMNGSAKTDGLREPILQHLKLI